MKQFALILATLVAVAGCRASLDDGPELGSRHGGYVLSFDDDDHHPHRRHCPPGHHMKGWC